MQENLPTISIFGLGYVGTVTAACLGSAGFRIIGVDVNEQKVSMLRQGRSPVSEPEVDDILAAGVSGDWLEATSDTTAAIAQSTVSIVCVGTPSLPSGGLDLSYVKQVAAAIAACLREKKTPHTLIFRSTMLPGSTRILAEEHLADLLDSGHLQTCFYPEFLREGSAVEDFRQPGLAVLGTLSEPENCTIAASIPGLFPDCLEVVEAESAEMLKYACNAFHATKVTFANEIGRLARNTGVDGRQVMDLLCRDRTLNISRAYLRPGTPFGGSCLPKDVSALKAFAREGGITLPAIESLQVSNQQHLEHLLAMVENAGHRRVVILGVAFKDNTDDLRGSPFVELAAALLPRGYEVRLIDPLIRADHVIGANETFARMKVPDLDLLLNPEPTEALAEPATLVVSKPCLAVESLEPLLSPDHVVIDINGWDALRSLPSSYHGICW